MDNTLSNPAALPQALSPEGKRGILAFPEIDNFYDTLMDRTLMAMGFFFEKPFTVFINALPRNHEEGTRLEVPRFGEFPLIYAGIGRQKLMMGEPLHPSEALESAWKALDSTKTYRMSPTGELDQTQMSTTKSAVSSALYQGFKTGQFSLKDVALGTLPNYFKKFREGNPGIFQSEEHTILSAYYNLSQYRYLSVPLIQFGEFDGVVHIIYHEDDHPSIATKEGDLRRRIIGNIIKAISREYEGIILDWDMVGGNVYRYSVVDSLVNAASQPDFYETLSSNPILRELGYRDHYEKHKVYFYDRIEASNQVPQTILQQYRVVAILSILLDSYTHNISAHSLVALEGWFKQRALLHDDKAKPKPEITNLPLIKEKRYFDYETHEFLRFMLDKGAFWTGLTRDYSVGGKINSLFTVLWRDFISNPLYLGSIAFTEGILELKINITFLEAVERVEGDVLWRKKVVANGHFATISLKRLQTVLEQWEQGHYEYQSGFIAKGEDFDRLRQHLKACKVYFPGGVVGKHAFFTILENEIRNVKHHSEAEIANIAKNGLTLNLSIQEMPYEEGQLSGRPTYYKIGVWLKHPVFMGRKTMYDRVARLQQDIINEQNRPRLGGAYQDKICAALLFNNSFSSVEWFSTKRDKRFYPWIKAGFSKVSDMAEGSIVEDYELSARRFSENPQNQAMDPEYAHSREAFERSFVETEGYCKKFFYVWRGENIFHYQGDANIDTDWENLSRYRFVYIADGDKATYREHFRLLREKGIVRINSGGANGSAETTAKAYSDWFHKWFKSEERQANIGISFNMNGETMGYLYWDGQATQYATNLDTVLPSGIHFAQWPVIHGSDKQTEEIRQRSHGIVRQYFMQGKDFSEASMSEENAAELLEALASNICMFDRRLYKPFEHFQTNKMATLGCKVCDEKHEQWQALANQENGFFRYHFLVVHLSFIEKFRQADGSYYTEEKIDDFIEKEILKGRERPENFMLVITSGRGRKQWQDTLELRKKDADKPDYTAFVTYRPVESLVSAVETALNKSDDMEMKYLVFKILMGS